MQITYNQWKCINYIEELRRQREVYSHRPDLAFKKEIMKQIDEKNKEFDQKMKLLNEFQEEDLIDQYQHDVSALLINYYNELSTMFQNIYTIFENQVALESHFDLNNYPKIKEFKEVVNVLKHNNGRAYNYLKSINSKYVLHTNEFVNIIPGMTSKIIMNIEYNDIEEFCNEVEKAWMDRYREYSAENTSKDDSLNV